MKKKKTIFKDKRITIIMSNGGETGSRHNLFIKKDKSSPYLLPNA